MLFTPASRLSRRSSATTTAAPPLTDPRRRPYSAAIALVILVALLMCAPAYSAVASSTCTKFASPQGSETSTGSSTAPFLTAQELINSLSPGQIGCLQAGTYGGGLTFHHGGTSEAPIVLRSNPGERAVVTGRVWIAKGSNYVTISDLDLNGNYQPNGETLPSPTVNSTDDVFESDDITNEHTAICFVLGSPSWGVADSTVISDDHIHDCGMLPATNYQHGIYVEDAANTQIVDNVIDDNADRGIQLYPYATGTVITGNVIAGNGEGIIFSGSEGVASNDNTVEHNLIVDSRIRHDVESWYPEGNPLGTDNIVRDNCVSSAEINTEGGGFAPTSNVTASAGEFSAEETGYSVKAGTACAAMVPNLPNLTSSASSPGAEETPGSTVPGVTGPEVPVEPETTSTEANSTSGAISTSGVNPPLPEGKTSGSGATQQNPTSLHSSPRKFHKHEAKTTRARRAWAKIAGLTHQRRRHAKRK